MRFNLKSFSYDRWYRDREFKIDNLKRWHSWFAWFPVRVDDDTIVWLEDVERSFPWARFSIYKSSNIYYGTPEYRLP